MNKIDFKCLCGNCPGFFSVRSKKGMEMVQVAILVAIAIAIGLLFKEKIMDFVNNTFGDLEDSAFSTYN